MSEDEYGRPTYGREVCLTGQDTSFVMSIKGRNGLMMIEAIDRMSVDDLAMWRDVADEMQMVCENALADRENEHPIAKAVRANQ